MKLLADGLRCSAATYLPGDHPVTLEIVRLGRGTGMTGASFMGSEISSTQYHVLRALENSPGTNLSELQTILPLDASTLSRTLSVLREGKLIEPERSSEKIRGIGFHLTREGKDAVANADKRAEEIIGNALAESPEDSIVQLHDLLEKVTAVTTGGKGGTVLQERIEVRELLSLADRQTARGLLLDSLIRRNKHFETPDEMFSPHNRCFGLYTEDRLVAACEIVAQGAEQTVINMAHVPQLESTVVSSFQTAVRKSLRG